MKRTTILTATITLAILATGLLAAPASAQTTINVSYTWTAPTTGSAVVSYIVQDSVDAGTFAQVGTSSTTSYTLAASVGHSHSIRVAGVDSQSRQGPWSAASDVYTPDAGAPGTPGKPTRL